MEIYETPIDERPRERLAALGSARLSDLELLQAIIGSGNRERTVTKISSDVLSVIDRLGAGLKYADLVAIPGLGSAKAALMCAAFEFARRTMCPSPTRIAVPADILPVIRHYADRKQEHFLCLSLNGAHEVQSVRVVSIGLVNRTIVHPREVFADPLTDRAAAVVVAHNHPSGRVEPSMEDRDVTRRLKQAGDTLGIRLLDHLIFSPKGYYSFLEHGEL